jgi:hypothetical protein
MLKHGANFFQDLSKTNAGLQPGVVCKSDKNEIIHHAKAWR